MNLNMNFRLYVILRLIFLILLGFAAMGLVGNLLMFLMMMMFATEEGFDVFILSYLFPVFIGIVFIFIEYKRYMKYKSRFKNEIESVVKEKRTSKSYAFHNQMGIGYFGATKNYLFFTPRNKSVKSTLINKSYITSYSLQEVGTGNYTTTFINGIGFSSEEKKAILHLNIKTPNSESYNYTFEVADWRKISKELDLPQFSKSNPQEFSKQFI